MNITEPPIEPVAGAPPRAGQAEPTREASTSPPDNEAAVDLAKVYAYVKRSKVMMVDDESVNLMAVEKHLRGFGYGNFVKTTEPDEALDMLRREKPDLLLMDIVMPRTSGLQLLHEIRSEPRWQCLPVIILTAQNDPATRREALDSGCSDFLTKPVDPCELALRVRNMLVSKTFYNHAIQCADQLEAQVDQQAQALAAAQQASELRYQSGKAEIATEVLHNVGNALNSVNVGVNLLTYTVRDSKLASLRRALALLCEHQGGLDRYLAKDERGRVLLPYLCEVADTLLQEKDKIQSELDLLSRHLEHINAVVATQQKHAMLCNVRESVALDALLADVDDLLGGAIARNNIEVIRDYEEIPCVVTDRQRLLQVLLNVIKNAADSIQLAQPSGGGRLEFRLGQADEQRAFVEIRDNGVGIPQEVLAKLFAHGFTTKRDGHGFGLHSCANIIQELGGSIQARSDGAGKGATFRLELPFIADRLDNDPL
ncbi:MAG: response regulator [Pirellulales bacterium]